MISSNASAYLITSGYSSSQAISFSGSNNSYFQAGGFTTFSISNQPFSLSLWVKPQSMFGILVYISDTSNSTGWCMPFMGLTTNASVVAQIYNGTVSSLLGRSLSLNQWSHVVQTWSTNNGLRLYVNKKKSSLSSATSFTASNASSTYIMLAGTPSNFGLCPQGLLNLSIPFRGDIDDFRVYNRELSSDDVCTIYKS